MLLATEAEEVLSVKDNLGPCHEISCRCGCSENLEQWLVMLFPSSSLRLTYQDLKYKQLDFLVVQG